MHIVEGNVVLFKDPTEFIKDVGNAMQALDYDVWFSTATDPCNYVFKKFCPRLVVNVDDEEARSKLSLPSTLSFTSHSNTSWTAHDFSKEDAPMKLDERFTIAMFTIIEFLARRRREKREGQLFYMN